MKSSNIKDITIIAEAGVNHNGSVSLAKKMIISAKKANASYVKFQIFKAENLCIPNAPKAKYQKKNTNKKESQYNMLKKYQLNDFEHKVLINFCKKNRIRYLASVFDMDSLNFIINNGIKNVKIPSGEINNHYLLALAAKKMNKIFLSTGASTMSEVKKSVKIILNQGFKKENLTLLHCNSDYPTLNHRDLNLNILKQFKKIFKCKIGYSDHTIDNIASTVSIALGADVIEKHFTLDNKLKGPDHRASLNSNEFAKFCNFLQLAKNSLGSYNKKPSNSEIKNLKVIRKSIYAVKKILKGEKFNFNNIKCLRPFKNSCASKYEFVLGLKARRNYKPFQEINV